MNAILLNVNIVPTTATHQSSLRVLKGRGGKFFIGKYKKSKLKDWIEEFKLKIKSSKPAAPLDGPIEAKLEFYFPYPKSTSKTKCQTESWKTTRPDLDNMEKMILDTLTDEGFLTDDSIICHKYSIKKLSDKPRIFIHLKKIDA
jgi:Holliday junction resolvase RusA-like endonuclease